MADIEMVDIENPSDGNGADAFVKAQPRRFFREKFGVPPNNHPDPDGLIAVAQPQQRSRYVCLCFVAFALLFISVAGITFTYMCMRLQPTTSVGRHLQFAGVFIGSMGLTCLAPVWTMFVLHLKEEVIDGNPEGVEQ